MSASIASQGTTITIQVGAGTATPILGIKQISGMSSGSTTVIDTSTLLSLAKEKAAGLTDEGQVKLSGQYIDSDPGQIACEGARATSTLANFVVTLANGTKFSFAGLVLTAEKGVQVDTVATFSANIEVSGPITKTLHS